MVALHDVMECQCWRLKLEIDIFTATMVTISEGYVKNLFPETKIEKCSHHTVILLSGHSPTSGKRL